MSIVRLRDVSKSYDSKPVLRGVNFRLDDDERVGLIGPNGAGKTTLLHLILGREDADTGVVDVDDGATMGYFSQFSELEGRESILDVLHARFPDITRAEADLAGVESAMTTATGQHLDRLVHRQADLMAEIERLGGWTLENRIDTVLSRLGFDQRYRVCPVEELSGGWRNRAALAVILLSEPGVLLLDEPTNFLDVDGVAWLEQWLTGQRTPVVVVSHDRHFLDKISTRIVEVQNYTLQEYEGSFTDYVRQKQIRLKSLDRQFEHAEELLILEAEAIADRRDALRHPGKALARRLADVGKRVEPRPVDKVVTDLYDALVVPNAVLEVEGVAKSYGDRTLFAGVSFELSRGERVAVVGPNGSGKTTLLRVLTGNESPDTGFVRWRVATDPCVFEDVLAALDDQDTVTHAVNVAPLAYSASRKKVNRFLTLLQLSDATLKARIGELSGGLRARVALAIAVLSGSPVLVMDEPTNHLDLATTQVMERALIHFPGVVIVATHDRFFIDKVATKVLLFDGGGEVRVVPGTWSTLGHALGR